MVRRRIILFCFFLSGATGLIYEILWARYFSLTFGSTTYSVTTVLTAFMAGLALGSLLFGRVADRIRDHVTLYGWLELSVGIYALLFPLLYTSASRLYLSLVGLGDISSPAKLSLKFLLSFALMMVPAILLGGTLPLLSRAFIGNLRGLASKLGLLYAVNTFGAVAGTYLVGFHLLSAIGLSGSMLLAGIINIGIGIVMIGSGRKLRVGAVFIEEEPAAMAEPPLTARERRVVAFAVFAFMVSGFVSLSHQVVWTRILTLIIGSSTYAFSMILIGFLAGIALGSSLVSRSRLFPPEKVGLLTFAWIEVGIGLSAFLLIPLFSKLPYVMLKAFSLHGESYSFITVSQFLITLAIVIVPTTLMGATLPVIGSIVTREAESVGKSIGNIYFFNTFGAIFGAFFAGFLFIPRLGTLGTLKFGIGINILLGLGALFLSSGHMKRWAAGGLAAVSLAGLFALAKAQWDPGLMDSGVSIYGKEIVAVEGLDKLKDGSRVLYLQEGVNSTISVRENESEISLLINGKTDASTSRSDMGTQLLLGHLPVMLHPEPRRALVIGLGSGVTASAIARHDTIRSVEIVEIEPSVAGAAEFFSDVSRRVLESPKVNLVINDARNHLLETERTYDIMVSEPSNPWISGVASLYTTDFYRTARARLARGGIFCQWIHTYSISRGTLAMVLRTLATSFEDVQLWTGDVGDLLVIASTERTTLDPARIREVVRADPGTEEEFRTFLMVRRPMEILGRLLLDRPGIDSFSEGALINSDDRPYLEFSAPRDLYRKDVATIYREILNLGEQVPPLPLAEIAGGKILSRLYTHRSRIFEISTPLAERYARNAIALDGTDGHAHVQLGRLLLEQRRFGESEEVIGRGLSMGRNPEGTALLADLLSRTGRHEAALQLLKSNRDILEDFERLSAEILVQAGDCRRAVPHLERSLETGSGEAYLTLEKLGICYERIGDRESALSSYERSIGEKEMNSRTQSLLGELYWKEGRYEEAARAFRFLVDHWNVRRHIYQRLEDSYRKLNRIKEADFIRDRILPKFDA